MAYMTQTDLRHRPLATLRDRLAAMRAGYIAHRDRRRAYLQVRDELMALDNRDLADIGIARGQIEEIARQHAYGA